MPHHNWGLGVPSSNLDAPTIYLLEMDHLLLAGRNFALAGPLNNRHPVATPYLEPGFQPRGALVPCTAHDPSTRPGPVRAKPAPERSHDHSEPEPQPFRKADPPTSR